MAPVIRWVYPMPVLLLTIRATELWTPLSIALTIVLGLVVLVALGWTLSAVTAKHDPDA
jgi:hypothetical protein